MELLKQIASTDADHISDVVHAAMQRYRELFPDLDIFYFSFERTKPRNEQIELQISILEQLKEHDKHNL